MIKICFTCKRKFNARRSKRKFCSRKCYGVWLSNHQKGERNHRYGKKATKKQKETMSKLYSGSKNPNYGKKMTQEQKERISNTLKKLYSNKENHPWFGKTLSDEHKRKLRISKIEERRIKYIEGFRPNFNLKACEYFKQFDENNNTKGLYGENEYLIEELGYFPDYINFDLKLIIEWDEEKHFINGKLREKDIQRQEEIQEYFPNFEFKRIRENKLL